MLMSNTKLIKVTFQISMNIGLSLKNETTFLNKYKAANNIFYIFQSCKGK